MNSRRLGSPRYRHDRTRQMKRWNVVDMLETVQDSSNNRRVVWSQVGKCGSLSQAHVLNLRLLY